MKHFFYFLLLSLGLSLYGETQSSLTLNFAGDIMSHDINTNTKPLIDIYKDVKELLDNGDLNFANLEFPVDENRPVSSYPSFNVHPDFVEAAIDGGFNVFSLANNHTNDFGLASVNRTIENMDIFTKTRGIVYSGIFKNGEDAFVTSEINIKGFKIGYLSVSQFNNNYWSKEGAKKVYTINYTKPTDVTSLENYIRMESEKYDLFILSYHGGAEYIPEPRENRRIFFRRLIDAGVDILWGHHPHVLQPWELIKTASGDKIIMYSLGNFISGQLAIVDPVEHDLNFAATGISAIFEIVVKKDNNLISLEPEIKMIANVRNPKRYFVAVKQEDFLKYGMSKEWEDFYIKMFKIGEHRIRRYE